MGIDSIHRRRFLGALAGGASAGLLRPQAAGGSGRADATTLPRRRELFNAGWRFRRQAEGGGALGSFDRDRSRGLAVEPAFRDAHQPDYDDSSWSAIFLPHTWNAHDGADDTPGYFRGIGWYRKTFTLSEEFRSKRVFLEFEGVNQVSECWVNGIRAGEHKGGYTSFEVDITQLVHFGGQKNVLAVKVDNAYDRNIAPTVKTDVTFYGGIYRDAWLRVQEPIYFSNVHWRTPRVSRSAASVDVFGTVVNKTPQSKGLRLIHKILDPAGKVVAEASSPFAAAPSAGREVMERGIKVSNPELWSPDSPSLYRIRSSIVAEGTTLDALEIPLGFRWYAFDADRGFLLNGERLPLRGTTWHQFYPGMGSALPNSRHLKDMENIREMGCNFFRTSHYPHDPAVLEACDRLGPLVFEELFVGEEVENTAEYLAVQSQSAEEMIYRDRNNPCVILWGLSGEVESAENSVATVNAILRKIRALDPSRPVTMHDPRAEGVKKTLDVVGLYSSFEKDDQDHQQFPDRKYIIHEYTAAAIGRGIHDGGPVSEEHGCARHEEFLRQVNLRPWIAGSVL